MKFSKFHQREQRRIPAEINLTTLVDIIFNLLLFYMLTASIGETPGIEVSLPKASAGMMKRESRTMAIVVTSDQNILVNDRAIGRGELQTLLRNFKRDQDQGRVLLRADKLAAHGNVVQVLDLVKESGIGEVAIATSVGD